CEGPACQFDCLGILKVWHVEDQAVESGIEQVLGLLGDAVRATDDQHRADILLVDPGPTEDLLKEALGLGVGLTDEQATQARFDNGPWISTDSLAVALKDIDLVAHHRGVAEEVAHVAVLRHQLERALLATT